MNPPSVAGCDTSEAAAESIRPHLGQLQTAVLRCILRAPGGRTCDSVEAELDMRHQTASARIRELSQRGAIVDSGERRPTRSGRKAIVWIPKPEPRPGQQALF